MRLLLSEKLPLRTTRMLGNYAEDLPLAHRYGQLRRFKLIRLDDKTFFAADHPMLITEVQVDDQRTVAWEQGTQSDGRGRTWTVVIMGAPVPLEAVLTASGVGKRNPRTGALLENPADIIEDVLLLAGRRESWDQLRAEAAAADLRLAGSVAAIQPVRAVIDAIAGSCGAIWCPGMARLYPVNTIAGYVGRLDRNKVTNLRVFATLDNTADILRLAYDRDDAGDKSQHYVEFTANPAQYGGVVVERTFGWLKTPANAQEVGGRILPWLAGERYSVTFDCGDRTVRPGQWQQIVAHPDWPFNGPDPTVMILAATPTPGVRTVACSGEALVSVPNAVVTAHTVGIPPTRNPGVEVTVENGVARLIVKDSNDNPVRNARVSMDGGQPKTSDATGLVTFAGAKPGVHKFAIQAPGKVPQTLTIPL